MATAVICVILVGIVIFSVKSYIKKISYGCCGSGDDSVKRIKPSDSNISNYPFAFKIDIDGMKCGNCKRRVENAFNEKEGFYAVVNLKEKNAVIRTKYKIEENELKNIIQREGYIVENIKELIV